jgi:hypothetical protein
MTARSVLFVTKNSIKMKQFKGTNDRIQAYLRLQSDVALSMDSRPEFERLLRLIARQAVREATDVMAFNSETQLS